MARINGSSTILGTGPSLLFQTHPWCFPVLPTLIFPLLFFSFIIPPTQLWGCHGYFLFCLPNRGEIRQYLSSCARLILPSMVISSSIQFLYDTISSLSWSTCTASYLFLFIWSCSCRLVLWQTLVCCHPSYMLTPFPLCVNQEWVHLDHVALNRFVCLVL